jgi:diguanylate cyclase (GGDEF)-like protein/PAS domain S-box-containing protein/putative nucleotidyltransferase with HDIG domain
MNLKYTFISPAILRILKGYTLEELTQMSIQDMLVPESFSSAVRLIKEELAREGMKGFDPYRVRIMELELRNKDGSTVWSEIQASFMRDSAGNVIGVQGSTRDITERRKAQQIIKESEERYRLLAENVSDVIWTMDLNLGFTYMSPSVLNIRGYTAEEALGMPLEDTVAPGSMKTVLQVIKEEFEIDHTEQYTSRTIEVELKCKNGSTVWTEMKLSWLHDASDNRIGIMGVTRDISERRKVAEALRETSEKLRVIFDSIGEAVTVVDMNGDIVDANREVLRLHGFNRKEEIIGRKSSELVAFVDRERAVSDAVKSLKTPYLSGSNEYKLVDATGREFDGEFNVAVIRDDRGNPTGFIGIARDISERKRMEEALLRINKAVESSSDAIAISDSQGHHFYHNRAFTELFGFVPEELEAAGGGAAAYASEDVAHEVFNRIMSGGSWSGEVEMRAKGGRVFTVLLRADAIKDEAGKLIGLIGVHTDITERKQIEEALKKSEEYFKAITENSSDIIVITDKDGTIKYCSRSVERYTGYRPEELVGNSAFNFIHPDDVQQAGSAFGEAVLTKEVAVPNEFRIVHKDGSVRVFGGLGKSLFDNPAVNGFIMNIHDVTESRWAEAALRNSEEKLRVTFNSMMDSVVVSDPNMNIVDVNKASLEVLGVKTKEELIGRNAAEVIRFKDQETALSNLSRILMERHPQVRVEYGIVLPDGRDMDVEVSTAMIHDIAGNVVGFVNVIRDVSERKQWEDVLRHSEEKYRNLVEREKDVIVSVDALGFVKTVNSAVNSWGYTVDEALKMNFMELIAPEWREVTATELQTRLLEFGEYIGETMVVRKDGEERPIEYTAVVIQEEGEYAGAQAIVRDISERKKAEEALEAKERYFRAITDLSSGAALVVNQEGVIVDVTGGLERISGHTREGTVGRSAVEFIYPEDLKNAGEAFDECLRNPGNTVTFEARLKNASGEWQWTECMITNLLDNIDVRGIVNHLVNITGRKKAEEEIRNHVKRIEVLYSVAQVISQSETLDKMLKDSLDKVCSAMDTESGCIFMLDLDENSLKLRACKGVPESTKHEFSSILLTEQGIDRIMRLQGPVTDVDDKHTVADIEGAKKVTAELGRKSIAATPLFRGNELQGFLVVFSSKEHVFSSEDLELFKATANEISLGINNMTLLEQTREMSVTDELTGLYNRRYFFEMLDVEMNRAGRTGRPFSVVMIDLDGFKEYNDKYGHSNGDAVLEKFAHVLMSSIRKSDLAFRYGGDEFAMILSGADSERARKIVQRTRAKWEKAPLKQPGTAGGQVGFSSGIAEYPDNAESSDGLIFLADAALYQAKRKGYEDKLVSELRTLSTNIIDVATQDQVYALAATVDARDPYTYGHSQRVADTALRIGRAIGMSSEDLAKLHAAALLHDIGKVGVPDAILTKPGKPSPEEWDLIRKHCAEGARIVGYVKEMATLVPIVLHHHEWYDGSGYPAGLKGLEIPPGARITSVADAYDTMVTKRPYRDAITSAEACEELKRNAGTQFDPVIVDVWCKLVEEEG